MVAEKLEKVVLLMGPTAVGKTALAVQLAESMNMEIISVDSALVYRGMDIGTAKPDKATLGRVPHHLIDIRDPSETYSAAAFIEDATDRIRDILDYGKIPLLCGGTMLYHRAITEGLSSLPSADKGIRRRLSQKAQKKGWQAMHERLAKIDPRAANRIHPNDPQRIQRALEVHEITGVSLSDWQDQHKPKGLPYNFIKVAVLPEDRGTLHQRIETRFDLMLEHGFIEEVEALRNRGDLGLDKPSMRCVGYRQLWEYLDGKHDLNEARLKGIYASRQLAKRQLNWLRSIPDIHRFGQQKSSHVIQFLGDIFEKS